MLKKTTLDFKSTGVLNQLLLDYLSKKETLKPFYGFFPDKKGFKELLDTKPYASFDRATLSQILAEQSATVNNSSEATLGNIASLKEKNTFTVTTGHQLCLFTGPLYFIYKIFSAINLAEELRKEFPSFRFIPVYWMASEDHDFEEVSSFVVNGQTFKWDSLQSGAVGDFDPAELKKQLPALREALGISKNADQLYKLFEGSYLKHKNLADATRFLVNELFGQYGLVTIDGNNKTLKQQFVPFFKKDLFENLPFQLVEEGVRGLSGLGYTSQVNPRSINCFYLEKGLRTRIEKQDDRFHLVGTEKTLTAKELETILATAPERISPNVVLRPLYQQVILPNLAYIGGPGELAYWLEFKKMFDSFGAVFPILMPRNFVTVVDKPTLEKIKKLNFTASDFFRPEQELVKHYMNKSGQVVDLSKEKQAADDHYTALKKKAGAIDITLEKHIAAELARVQKKLDAIGEKANRALKRKAETELNRINSVKQTLFPGGVPQERHDNFSSFYLSYGPSFFETVKESIDPFGLTVKVLVEEG